MRFNRLTTTLLLTTILICGVGAAYATYTDPHAPGNTAVWDLGASGLTVVNSHVLPKVDPAWRVEAVCDLDGDGISDIILRDKATGDVVDWILDANDAIVNSAYLAHATPLGWHVAGCAGEPAKVVLHFN